MYPKYFEISLRSPYPVWSVDAFLHFVNNRGSRPANLNSGQEFDRQLKEDAACGIVVVSVGQFPIYILRGAINIRDRGCYFVIILSPSKLLSFLFVLNDMSFALRIPNFDVLILRRNDFSTTSIHQSLITITLQWQLSDLIPPDSPYISYSRLSRTTSPTPIR
ncbi:hypothetical protein YC2023_023521 [Brassica napus]